MEVSRTTGFGTPTVAESSLVAQTREPLFPLRLTPAIAGVAAVLLIVVSVLPAFALYPGDWPRFWAAGATAGTAALTDASMHVAFQVAHGLVAGAWTYPPAFAWAFVPAAALTIAASYAVNFAFTLGVTALAGWLLAGALGFDRRFGIAAALAWEPAIYSAAVGQISALWLAAIAIAVWATERGNTLLLGLSVSALLFKPPLAVVFVAVLVVRRQWKACAVVAAATAGVYLASVTAAGGNWHWIPNYLATLRALQHTDLGALYNGMTLPALLARAGLPTAYALGVAVVCLVALLPGLARSGNVRALCVASLLALAVSPHAWMYDAALALPAIFYAMRELEEPARTWLVAGAYVVAAFWMPVVWWTRFNPLALIVLLGSVLAAAALYRKRASSQTVRA
jgi:hypothetical protein